MEATSNAAPPRRYNRAAYSGSRSLKSLHVEDSQSAVSHYEYQRHSKTFFAIVLLRLMITFRKEKRIVSFVKAAQNSCMPLQLVDKSRLTGPRHSGVQSRPSGAPQGQGHFVEARWRLCCACCGSCSAPRLEVQKVIFRDCPPLPREGLYPRSRRLSVGLPQRPRAWRQAYHICRQETQSF